MKLYECIIDDGNSVFKTITAAKNKKELLNTYGGNGTFEKNQRHNQRYPTYGRWLSSGIIKNYRLGRKRNNITHRITTTTFRFNQIREDRPWQHILITLKH